LPTILVSKAFVDGVTAAATGAIAGAAFVLGRRAIIDLPTALIAAGTSLVLLRIKQLPELLVAVAGGVGLVLHG
jgi:chromate transporter